MALTINNSDNNKLNTYAGWFLLALVIAVVVFIRIRLLGVPLERDEGEFAYIADLVMKGGLPYKDVYSMKLPGIFYAYALILSLFGHSHSAIHFALLILNIITTLLVYFLGKKLFDHWTGIIAASCYAIMSLSPSVYGISAHATNFVILPALGGILVMLYANGPNRGKFIFLSGLLIGVSVLMKQHGIMFAVYGMVYLAYSFYQHQIPWRQQASRYFLLLAGILLPYIMVCLYFYAKGDFDEFWFFTVTYPRKYIALVGIQEGLKNLRSGLNGVITSNIAIWASAFAGIIILAFNKKLCYQRFTVISFLGFSFLAVCPGLYFREHYFILLLPAVALLAGVCISWILNKIKGHLSIISRGLAYAVLSGIILIQPLYSMRDYYFSMSPYQISHFTYGAQPFWESLEIAHYIKEQSSKDDRIAILGSEPQICFYAERNSATGFIYMYPLFEPHKYADDMLTKMFYEINSSRPKFIVITNVQPSWGLFNLSGSFQEYLKQLVRDQLRLDHYIKVGVIDIISEDETRYKWGEDALTYAPYSKDWLVVYRRND